MFDELSPGQTAIAVILGILAVAGLIGGEVGFAVLMGIIAAVYINRQLEENRRETESTQALNTRRQVRERQNQARRGSSDYYEADPFEGAPNQADDYFETPPPRPANVEQVHKHALQAVRRAGLNPDSIQVLPVDLGLLKFQGDDNPVIHRSMPVPADSDYIQPFVQLRVPVSAAGRIKFEVFDDAGQKIFAHEDKYQLERGRNLIIPATRLPIHDEQNMDGRWSVKISADGTLLAEHTFNWTEEASEEIRPPVSDDGEISNEMRAMLADSRLQDLSLDALLAHQDENDQQMQGR